MNKKIILSLSVIAAVAAIVVGGTMAYFSDTEKSAGNTFTAGTIDISVDGHNPWSETAAYTLDDMKPGYVDHTNFVIKNKGTNPANITKSITGISDDENGIDEPECVAYSGSWDGSTCSGGTAVNNLQNVITYDLSVVVKDSNSNPIWNQTLYNNDKTIAEIQAVGGMFLGMIPVGGTMEVTESYHMLKGAGNKYQSDKMTFNITLVAEQLKGSIVLEDKDPSDWRVLSGDSTMATLNYAVKGDTFDYTLAGISPVISGQVALVAGYDTGTNPDTLIGYGTTDGSGSITMNTNTVDLGKDLTNAKVWLIPVSDWSTGGSATPGTIGQVVNWHKAQYLWETGLIDYYDTNS